MIYMVRILRAAAVQHVARLGQINENMERVRPLIERAVNEGAKLVALPEMSLSGYTLNKEMWDYSEPVDGPTEKWLKEKAMKHQIFLCGGLTQHEGSDFYNTYLIVSPEGETIGRVRKTQTEFNIHRAGPLDGHIVDTDSFRIGIGICADTHMTFFPKYMREKEIDLLLSPHAWPILYKLSKFANKIDIVEQEKRVKDYASFYAKMLGVPTVFIDQTGSIEGKKWPGITGKLMDIDCFRYPGFTTIATPQEVIAQLDDSEDFIVADINMDNKEPPKSIPNYHGLVHSGSLLFRLLVYGIDLPLSKLKYKLSENERKKAIKIKYTIGLK